MADNRTMEHCSKEFPVNYPPQETSKENFQAREDLMEAIQAFLKEKTELNLELCIELILKLYGMICKVLNGKQQKRGAAAPKVFISIWMVLITPKVILIAWECFGEIKDALIDKQYQQEDIQELMSKLLEDVRNISEEFLEYINCLSWNRPLFYFDDDDDEYTVIWRRPKVITPDESLEDSLIMGDEHFDTIPEKESDELIKFSVENLVPIPSESEDFSDNESECDMPHRGIEKADFVLEEEIRLVENLLYDNSSPRSPEELNLEIVDTILESLSPSTIPITDSDSLMEEIDLFLASDDSMPLGIEDDDYDSKGDIRFLEEFLNNDSLPLPENESSNLDHFNDPSFPRPPPEPSDVEISLIFEADVSMINNVDELNEDECFDPGGGKINVEIDNSFTFVTWIFLPYLTYPEVSPLLSSTRNEDTIFDPGIST
ncbi:hypothetical protein Tco_1174281 [Tanacetum coccineum]